ncbi:hypothetical protein [Actinocorallia longicatena]|uniref:DUF3311 domain-containing protein n=1 Tax=Actinocorallia longicatena TaxID=111803 RepID=A0ABP6Q4S2_9ACTN
MGKRRDDRLSSRLVAVTVLGFLLLGPPILSLFDHGGLVLGVPLVWVYVFLAWAAVIGVVAALTSRAGRRPG